MATPGPCLASQLFCVGPCLSPKSKSWLSPNIPGCPNGLFQDKKMCEEKGHEVALPHRTALPRKGIVMTKEYDAYRRMAQVWFMGVGPGDPDLMTVRSLKIVQCADIILHEGGQINQAILDLRSATSTLVDCHKKSVEEVAGQCLDFARKGKLVARLLTGDPCIFSPALEEMDLLQKKDVSCALVPGISAAFWAASLAQKSLTPKHTHQTFTIMRFPAASPLPPGQGIKDICKTGACMAIYLANKKPQLIVSECLEAGLPPTAPILVIQSTGKSDERLTWLRLADLTAHLAQRDKTQSLVLIWP